MDVLAERLDKKLQEWSLETAERVRSQLGEIIELADYQIACYLIQSHYELGIEATFWGKVDVAPSAKRSRH